MLKHLAFALVLAIGISFTATAQETIDGSSENAALMSFMEIVQDLPPEQQEEASMAIVLIYYDGMTMEDIQENPELEEPDFGRILHDIDGLTAEGLIARGEEAEGPIVDLVREQADNIQ